MLMTHSLTIQEGILLPCTQQMRTTLDLLFTEERLRMEQLKKKGSNILLVLTCKKCGIKREYRGHYYADLEMAYSRDGWKLIGTKDYYCKECKKAAS